MAQEGSLTPPEVDREFNQSGPSSGPRFRTGLGFLPAFTITSDPFPPPVASTAFSDAPRSHYSLPASSSASSHPEFGPNSIPLIPKNRYPAGYPSYAQWKEWHINPTQHGPEGSTGPPVFVPSTLKYDELGRSILHGVGVEVDTGIKEGEGREDGDQVAEWYTSLARSSRGVSKVAEVEEEGEAGPSKPRSADGGIIDLTGDDDDDDSSPAPPVEPIPQPLKVHRNEWFIRRALLSNSSTTPSFPPRPLPSTSIGTLLNIPPTQNRATEPVYVLGPDHIGHQILRQRLGWGGGGLGRPDGWEPPVPAVEQEVVQADGSREDAIVIHDSDEEEEDEGSEDELPPTIGGPGRTAPVATALKLDRLGLGHRFAVDRIKVRGGKVKELKEGEGRKKVTHTHAEILEAQRRAKYSRAGAVMPKGGEVLGKKGKIKWKEKDKKERDERRRMIAALND